MGLNRSSGHLFRDPLSPPGALARWSSPRCYPVQQVRSADALTCACRGMPTGAAVVRRGTREYDQDMGLPDERPTDVSVRQFVADSGSVTRGLRQGRTYT